MSVTCWSSVAMKPLSHLSARRFFFFLVFILTSQIWLHLPNLYFLNLCQVFQPPGIHFNSPAKWVILNKPSPGIHPLKWDVIIGQHGAISCLNNQCLLFYLLYLPDTCEQTTLWLVEKYFSASLVTQRLCSGTLTINVKFISIISEKTRWFSLLPSPILVWEIWLQQHKVAEVFLHRYMHLECQI